MLAILISRNVNNRTPETMIPEKLAIINSRNVGKYNFLEYWQLASSESFAIIFVLEMLASNAGNSFCSEMATKIDKYNL